MTRRLKRNSAIKKYARQLPQELKRRFGTQRFYTFEQVTKAVEQAGFDTNFIAYGHALLCSRAEFDAHYGPAQAECGYTDLRMEVARRYLRGIIDFDAASLVRATEPDRDGDYYDSPCDGLV